MIEKDVSCDSHFMMTHIREIGAAIRKNYSFVPEDDPIVLFMDNAGGHGKTEVKREYEKILKEEFNVCVEWQVPNSPETNMLDLGVWASLQSKVEILHRGKVMQSDELSKTVHQAFNEITSDVLTKVHERWKMVLHLIVSGKGTNEVVEEHRGKMNRSLLEEKDLPTIPNTIKLDGYYSLTEDEDEDDAGKEKNDKGSEYVERLYDKC